MTTDKILWEEKNLTDQQKSLFKKEENDNCDTIIETKKDLTKKEQNDTTKISGIYKIINKVNGKYYVGSSSNIHKRWGEHIRSLNHKKHFNQHLQRSWNKYKQSSFEFIIFKVTPTNNTLLEEEQKCLDNVDKNQCYNTSLIAGKVEMTDEVKEKIRQKTFGHKRNLGRKYEPITAIKRTLSRRKNNILWHSDETKEKIRIAHTGKTLSEQHKINVGLSGIGRIPYNKDYTLYTFKNQLTNEIFTGTKSDFIKKYNLQKCCVYGLISGVTSNKQRKCKSHKGWIIVKK